MNPISRLQVFLKQNGPFKLALHIAAHPKYRWELFKSRHFSNNKIRIVGDIITINQSGNEVKFQIQGDFQNTVGLIFENFLYEEYGDLDVKSKKVIDIGASIADTALYFAAKGAQTVYGYEIDTSRQAEAAKNISLNPQLSGRIMYMNEGIDPQKLTALIDRIGKCSIKIDCDNSKLENDLIAALSESNMANVEQIIMEYSSGYAEIEKKLKLYNFKVTLKPNKYYNSGILFAVKNQ